MKSILSVLVILLVGAVAASPLMAADNPFVGTWKLNVAKSKADGAMLPKSLTRTITTDGTTTKYAFDGTAADGSAITYSFSTSYDGKESPVMGTGMPGGADTITLKHYSAHKTEGTLKKGGKQIAKVTAVVSSDGKTSTVTAKGTGPDGKPFSTVSVYEKQ